MPNPLWILILFLPFSLASNNVFIENNENNCPHVEHEERELKLFVTTFNVNGEFPERHEELGLNDWIKIDHQHPPDIVVIGLQEMTRIADIFGSYMLDGVLGKLREEKWIKALEKYLGKKEPSYKLQRHERQNGIFLAIFLKNNLEAAHTKVNKIKTGYKLFFHVFGNKGGVGISFQLDCVKICFINSHLAAGNKPGKLEKRNSDYREIVNMTFDNNLHVLEHDLIIWSGDLNYRLTTEKEIEIIKEEIATKGPLHLLKNDQFKLRDESKVFVGFEEADIGFGPTYKYAAGSNDWHKKKPEIPAWCDRILYKVKDGKKMEIVPTKYYTVDDPDFSDHKPVIGEFNLILNKKDGGENGSGSRNGGKQMAEFFHINF